MYGSVYIFIKEKVMEDKNPIQVADRLFGVLEYLATTDAAGLMDVANHMNLNKSTTHRILTSLQYMGYVKQNDEQKYELTMKIVEISSKVMGRVDVISVVRPKLRLLMEVSGETVHFVKRDGNDAVYIDKVDSHQNAVQMISHIGSRIPLFCSGVGKAMAATFTSDDVRNLWKNSNIVKLTPHTIVDYIDFEDDLSLIRKRGYAVDDEENELGVRCIATDISAHGKEAEFAISISAPVSRMSDDRIAKLSEYMLKTRNDIIDEIRPLL